jgi:hypothetical protein
MKPWTLTHGVGVGDFFDVDSVWSDERRAALTTVYHSWWGSEGSRAFLDVMQSCPAYQHVEHCGTSYPTERVEGSVLTLRDQPILHRLTYHGSAFLKHTLECEVPHDLPEAFVYVQPSTPKNGASCDRWIRDEEWNSVLDRLEEWGLPGLVVNLPGGKATVPDHPSLLNWSGRTTMPQAVEILKRASGYLGVDSCFAILAAQLFGPDRLAIRTNNPYVIEYPHLHYPPHTDFAFLYPAFGQNPHTLPLPSREPTLVLDLKVNCLIGTRTHIGGGRVEMPRERALKYIAAGHAVEVSPDLWEVP